MTAKRDFTRFFFNAGIVLPLLILPATAILSYRLLLPMTETSKRVALYIRADIFETQIDFLLRAETRLCGLVGKEKYLQFFDQGYQNIDSKIKNVLLLPCNNSTQQRSLSYLITAIQILVAIAAIVFILMLSTFLKHEKSVRIRVEEELLNVNDHLNDLVLERTKELQLSELRWHTALTSLADAVVVTNETGQIVFMNATAESTTGWSAKEALHKPLHEFFKILDEDCRQPLNDIFTRVFNNDKKTALPDHVFLLKKNGEKILIDCHCTQLKNEYNSQMGVVFVFHDSTEHWQVKDALRNQTTLLNFAHDAIIVFNAENTITFWNHGAEETYGWTSAEAVGRMIHDLLKTQYPMPSDKIRREVENTGEWNGELTLTCKDSHEVVVTSRWTLQRDTRGQVVSILEIDRDITERKKIEETLKYERELLKVVLDDLNSGIILFDNKGALLTFNKTASDWYGFSAESEMWKHSSDYVNEFILYNSDDVSVPFEKWPVLQAINGEFVKDYELKLTRRQTGNSRWISFTTVPVQGAHKEEIHILMGMTDITKRKEYEKQLLRKNKVLQYVKDILAEAIRTESEEVLGEKCLELAISLTGSQYGFIGEIGPDGYLHDIAISGMARQVCAMFDKTYHSKPAGHFTIHGLYGRVLSFKSSFYTNKPSSHPDQIGVPGGHPLLMNFLGVPFVYQEKTIGMIGLANKAGGYTDADVEDIEAMAPSIVEGLLRKRAEHALRENEEKFRRIFDSNLLAIAFLRSNGFLTDANQALCDILGCTREEVVSGKVNWKNQTPPEIIWRDEMAINEIRNKGVCTPYEKTFIHRDGHHVPVLIGGASIGAEDQGVTYIIDLTQQKKYEKSLKEAQRIAVLRAREAEEGKRMLDAIMENIPEGITISDTNGRIIMVSKFGEEILGGFHLGMSIEEVARNWTIFRPDGTVMPIAELPLVRALKNETVKNIELLELTSEGHKLPLLCNAAPIHDDGRVVNGIVVWRDISEIKKTEQTRLESEETLEDAQRISHVGSWIWNVETSKLFCSAETFRIYGEEPFSFQPTIEIFISYVHPEDQYYLKSVIGALQTGCVQEINKEFRIIRKDGSIRHIHSIAETKEFTENGKPHLIKGTGQDITERKQAEEALLESESRLRLAQQVARIGSFEYDFVNNKSRWSPEMEILHGLKPGEYSGSYDDWLSFVYHDDLPVVEHILFKAVETGHFETEWRIVRSDGAIRWMTVRGQLFKDISGRPVRMVGVNLDITERKKAEQDIQTAAERFRIITSSNIVGCAIVDFNGVFYFANDYFLHIVGYSRQEFEDGLVNWKALTPPEYVALDLQALEQLHSTGTCTPYEKQYSLRDGSRPWIYISAVMLPGIQQILAFVINITERKKAEEKLRRYTGELAAANRDLESFSYSVSHDLRSPLGLIDGFTSLLIDDYAEILDKQGRDYLKRIDNSVKRMLSLINDMLALSRISRQEIKRSDVNLSETIQNYLTELQNNEPNRKVKSYIQKDICANADPHLIHLALENILRNAWKFTSKRENTRIEFGTIIIDNNTVYFIRDNGIGFDMKFADKIFEPFRRVPTEKEFGGTGVGLSIVQRVVERHGGKVWAEGDPGKGATFFFTLPD